MWRINGHIWPQTDMWTGEQTGESLLHGTYQQINMLSTHTLCLFSVEYKLKKKVSRIFILGLNGNAKATASAAATLAAFDISDSTP